MEINGILILLIGLFIMYHEQILNTLASSLDNYLKMKKIMNRPKRIILVRHGESQANVNSKIYDYVPDKLIDLTDLGKEQAKQTGRKLREILKEESVNFYVSPLLRAVQTYRIISLSFEKDRHKMFEDPKLREQEWGNFQDSTKIKEVLAQRDKIGKFYFRFQNGESGADVYDRASLFIESMFRDLEGNSFPSYCAQEQGITQNVVVVSHGLFIRLFLMKFFKLTVEEFEKLENPKNGSLIILEKSENGNYLLKKEEK